MLREKLVEFIESMLNNAGTHTPALCIHNQPQAPHGRFPCPETPCPNGMESAPPESHFSLAG
jgi:hypothetical protein